MGSVRFTLALAVFCIHAGNISPNLPLANLAAVNSFYVISGYLICRVLNTRYPAGLTARFYLNRWMRLAPAYIALSALIVLFVVLQTGTYGGVSEINKSAVGLALLSHLIIVGQDWFHFLVYDFDRGWFRFVADAESPSYRILFSRVIPGDYFLIIPQGWTLGIEVTFYLLAPWILRRGVTATLLACIFSFAFREAFLAYVANDRTWAIFFAPTNLGLFWLGALGYFVVPKLALRGNGLIAFAASSAAVVGLVLISTYGDVLRTPQAVDPFDFDPYYYFEPAVVALAAPMLAQATANARWDGFLGALSYPMYITHLFCIVWLAPSLASDPAGRWGAALGATLSLSLLLIFFVERPIEQIRRRIHSGKSSMGL